MTNMEINKAYKQLMINPDVKLPNKLGNAYLRKISPYDFKKTTYTDNKISLKS